ncbi:MAG TPA: hypothetical protein PKL15_04010, partial [Saprospiraceae bacterium]|nr:hypothetical protein [Saprospiraceae bacterium]
MLLALLRRAVFRSVFRGPLLALVVAPPVGTAMIHRVEALLLQANVVMVIVITSSGDVTKRAFTFAHPVDP